MRNSKLFDQEKEQSKDGPAHCFSTCTRNRSECNKTRKGNKTHADWEGRNKLGFVGDDMIEKIQLN